LTSNLARPTLILLHILYAMSSFRSTSILFTVLSLPLLLQAMPMSPPVLVHRELPQMSSDLKVDADVTICPINGVNVVDPTLVLGQLERGDDSTLENIGIDINNHDLVNSVRNLLRQCASAPFEEALPPLSSIAAQGAALINDLTTSSTGNLGIPKPDRNGNTPQDGSDDVNDGTQDGGPDDSDDVDDGTQDGGPDEDESEDDNVDESDDMPAKPENSPDDAGDESRENSSSEGDDSENADTDAGAQDDHQAEDASRTSDSNESNDNAPAESQDTDKENGPTIGVDGQTLDFIESFATSGLSVSKGTSLSTDKQNTDAPGNEGCSSQGTDSSQFEDRLCVDSQVNV